MEEKKREGFRQGEQEQGDVGKKIKRIMRKEE